MDVHSISAEDAVEKYVIEGKEHCFRIIKPLANNVVLAKEVLKDGRTGLADNRELVIKRFELELPAHKEERKNIVRSIKKAWRRMCDINHQNVLACIYAVLELETTEEKFLRGTQIMANASKGDLVSYMKESSNFTTEEAKHYSHQLLQGVDYLHKAHSVIHGDLKPANIVVFEEPSMPYGVLLKIIDLEDHAALSESVTKPGDGEKVTGTKRYMSPERIRRGNGAFVGRATDIWSLGCIALAMLTNEQEFAYAFHELGFSDPFDPLIKERSFETLVHVEKDFRYCAGLAVPIIPSAITDPECKRFLKACLTVDKEKRATTSELLMEPWLAIEQERWLSAKGIAKGCSISVYRHKDWNQTVTDQANDRTEWDRGVWCAGALLMHSLQLEYSQAKYECMSQAVVQQLRNHSFTNNHITMCNDHLTAVIPTLTGQQLKSAKWTQDNLKSHNSASELIRPMFPVYLSLRLLSDNLNQIADDTMHYFKSKSKVDWRAVKVSLDHNSPVICQIVENEVDQNELIRNEAEMVGLINMCPLKLIELEFVILTGYLETETSDTFVTFSRTEDQSSTMKLQDFERIWNWDASDPLLRQYLLLERVKPASALFCAIRE